MDSPDVTVYNMKRELQKRDKISKNIDSLRHIMLYFLNTGQAVNDGIIILKLNQMAKY